MELGFHRVRTYRNPDFSTFILPAATFVLAGTGAEVAGLARGSAAGAGQLTAPETVLAGVGGCAAVQGSAAESGAVAA